jgi:hypothetical protein
MAHHVDGRSLSVSPSTVYRQIGDELIVIQADSGVFYYFNPGTKGLLDLLRCPRDLGQLYESLGLDSQAEERRYLNEFTEFLLDEGILQPSPAEAAEAAPRPAGYERPQFLRRGDRKLEDLASEIAVMTQGFL